jgi:hypothetical protein
MTITDQTLIHIYDGDDLKRVSSCTWAKFVEDNDSMVETGEIVAVRDALATAGRTTVGGGAAGLFLIEVAASIDVLAITHQGHARYRSNSDMAAAFTIAGVRVQDPLATCLIVRGGEVIGAIAPVIPCDLDIRKTTAAITAMFRSSSSKAA